MKKIEFGATRPSTANQTRNVDDWVHGTNGAGREPMKRLTIDVPVGLHKRIKSQCALGDLVMADVIRDLLDKRFPEPKTPEGNVS